MLCLQLRGDMREHVWVCCAVAPVVLRNDEVDWEQLCRRLAAGDFNNIVISPGPGTPSCAADIGETAALPDMNLVHRDGLFKVQVLRSSARHSTASWKLCRGVLQSL
jgi:hypothetical protein